MKKEPIEAMYTDRLGCLDALIHVGHPVIWFDRPLTPQQVQAIQDLLTGEKHIHKNPPKKADRKNQPCSICGCWHIGECTAKEELKILEET
jgi:hypothetical protein